MNPTRCRFIRDAACSHFGRGAAGAQPLAGLSTVDVGCGGGILCVPPLMPCKCGCCRAADCCSCRLVNRVEPLARLGSQVLGVDAVAKSVDIARAHAARDPVVAARAQYRACTAEQLVAEGQRFDLVTSLEVVEHVADVPAFLRVLTQLLRPGGLLVMSTVNRTVRSYMLGIVAAEHLLQWVPAGTHSWQRFLTPEELTGACMQELPAHTMAPDQGFPIDRDAAAERPAPAPPGGHGVLAAHAHVGAVRRPASELHRLLGSSERDQHHNINSNPSLAGLNLLLVPPNRPGGGHEDLPPLLAAGGKHLQAPGRADPCPEARHAGALAAGALQRAALALLPVALHRQAAQGLGQAAQGGGNLERNT